jgi:AraC-like DNA-binding protein
VIKITPEVTHNMLEYHSLIAKSHRRKENVYSELQTKALIFALLMEVAGVYSSTPIKEKVVSRQGALADDFFRLMLQAYKTERNVAYYADQLCLSPKYLSTTIKKVTGYPISEWINRWLSPNLNVY